MLANSCWQTQIGVCEQHNNNNNCWRQIELVPILANLLLRRSHTLIWVCQHELANISLTREGRFRSIEYARFPVVIV